ncbi:penicillin-insensitive murein endopeptidase [Acidimangrovimonas pyrenivorans]|uniref:Penicillin-insensitive murein endopeptidase n=1 Tax=Acidimangrovimonas pyrenivorans TaxID=2030798 RepID=A0ABV7AD42_9RHOB
MDRIPLRLIRRLTTGLALALALAGAAPADPLATRLFGAEATPSDQKPMPIGSYARGCAAGLVQLPETGPTWQAMRLGRDRNWGQPVTVAFLEDLSRVAAQQKGWNGLYIGDIGQPRGGPMASGHQSHQIGLDADIWMRPGTDMHLSRAAREKIGSIPVRTADQTRVNGKWTRAQYNIMKAAASDPRVDRIFVAAAVKVEMCKTAKPSDTSWLQKIRPWYGHASHFHIRLKCPPGATLCQTQRPTVAQLSHGGNGCDKSLRWWVTDYLEALKHPPKPKKNAKKRPHRKGPREFTMADLPAQCANVLASR